LDSSAYLFWHGLCKKQAIMSIGLSTSIKGASPEIVQAIQLASRKTGVDFDYLVNQAKAESSFRADAKASTSSATGLYQFIESTWLETVKKHGNDHGLQKYIDHIETDFQGRNFVSNDTIKKELLDLRKDPQIASVMAAEFASNNQQILEHKIGRDVNATDLYFAHFLGAGGASKFLNALESDPNQSAAILMPSAAKSNQNIFYNSDSSHKSLMSVYKNFEHKFSEKTEAQIVSENTSDVVSNDIENDNNTYRVDPQFSRFYSKPVNDFVSSYPSIESLKMDGIFTSLFQNSDISRMQNQVIDPVSFLILTGLDSPK
jgi:hypothetical protein